MNKAQVIILAVLATATILRADTITPVGDDFQINSTTTGDQGASQLAADPDGGFVVVWQSSPGDGDNYGINGQWFEADGLPLGGEFVVNSYTTGAQRNPSVVFRSGGEALVTWEGQGGGHSFGIWGRTINSSGPVGTDFKVHTETQGRNFSPQTIVQPNSDFIVVWSQSEAVTIANRNIVGTRFQSNGSAIGEEFAISTVTLTSQDQPNVAVHHDGAFVVTWRANGSIGDDPDWSVQARRVASDGTPLGSHFQVNTLTSGAQTNPDIALENDGDFLVVWQSSVSSGDDSIAESIQGRFYNSNGTAVGSEFQVNSGTFASQTSPVIEATAATTFLVMWDTLTDTDDDLGDHAIAGRALRGDGTFLSEETQINSYTTGGQQAPQLAVSPSDSSFFATWVGFTGNSPGDDDQFGVVVGRLGLVDIFRDGFESGDTTAWSSSSE